MANKYDCWTGMTSGVVKDWFKQMETEDNAGRTQALNLIQNVSPLSLLEIGPGSGIDYQSFKINIPGCKYHGIDVAQPVIDELKTKYPEMCLSQANLYDGLPFLDKSFDVVYARHVLLHLPYYDKPLKEMCRIASKLVVVVLFKPLTDKDRLIFYQGRNKNRYGRNKFLAFASTLGKAELISQNFCNKEILTIKIY